MKLTEISVVLVRPTEEGNVGAVARAMANMGLERLVLVEPAVAVGKVARAFAVHAEHVLKEIERAPSLGEALADVTRAVGTTSNRSRALGQPVIAPGELPALLAGEPAGTRAALVFGPERTGLSTEELALLSPLVRIPASPVQPTLNLAQAVLICAYELFQASDELAATEGTESDDTDEPAAPHRLVEGLFEHYDRVLPKIGFARDDTARSSVRGLRRFFARAAPSEREVAIFRGILRRTERALERAGAGDKVRRSMSGETSTRRRVAASVRATPIFGVVRTDDRAEGVRQARALIDGGVELVEITFTVPDAPAVVRELLAERDGDGPPWIGMGTVTGAERAAAAVAAGAEFIVSPNVSRAVAAAAKEADLYLVLGALTCTEIVAARDLGADIVKVYPLPAVGGPPYLGVVRGPLGDVPMLAAGGFPVAEIPAYREAGAIAFGMAAPVLGAGAEDAGDRMRQALALARGEEKP